MVIERILSIAITFVIVLVLPCWCHDITSIINCYYQTIMSSATVVSMKDFFAPH